VVFAYAANWKHQRAAFLKDSIVQEHIWAHSDSIGNYPEKRSKRLPFLLWLLNEEDHSLSVLEVTIPLADTREIVLGPQRTILVVSDDHPKYLRARRLFPGSTIWLVTTRNGKTTAVFLPGHVESLRSFQVD
jgi:hypothetical protein